AEDGIRDKLVTGVQTCALPIFLCARIGGQPMGHDIELNAADGHRLTAYLAEPLAKPRGGLVVVQEIFGVTRHIRAVADEYAAAGFLAIAPALFDRVERDVDVPYTDISTGLGYMKALKTDQTILDVQAAADRVAAA